MARASEPDNISSALVRPVTQKAISRVVLAGFALVILLLLAAGLLGVRSISSIRSTTAELLEEQVRIQDLLDAVLREQRAINAIFAGFAKQPENLDRQQLLSQLEASDRDIESIAADAADEPAQALWQDLYKAVTHYSTEARGILSDESGKARPLRQLMAAHQNVLALVDKLVEVQSRRSVELKQQLESISERLLRESSILLGAGLLLALACAIYTVKLTVNLIRQLEWQTGELSRVSWNLLEKQETTARRFSHELHDELGQSLTAVKANLVTILDHANGGRAQVDDCLHLVDAAIVNVRELSQLLRPTILDDFGLDAGLRWLCDRFQQRTGVNVEYSSTFDGRVADETETHIFRIAQEALTNVARHSKATKVEVSLANPGGQIELRIADNGRGVVSDGEKHSRGLGLVGMRARARSAGGELKVETAPNQGVAILASFPFAERLE
ncbi:sensor histidine kinase [Paludibaculum fermentans]|uniref:sensor histidine kinase n=1 Tax=Paludibaculum fermentans TaxID=1473598 RepID=UPI003EB933F6